MVAVSKEESMLLIQHAISAYLNEGKNQTDLGELLGLPTPRISEYKVGKGKLSPNQRKIIIDNYGYPRRGKGQYIRAEVYDTVTEFINDYEESSKKRLKRRLYELLMRKDYLEKILESVEVIDGENSDKEKLRCIDQLLLSSELEDWYKQIKLIIKKRDVISLRYSAFGINESLLEEFGLFLRGGQNVFGESLYRIAGFKYELMQNFSFNNLVNVPSVGLNELIITGDVVLECEPNCSGCEEQASNVINGHASLPFNDQTAHLFGDHDLLCTFVKPSRNYHMDSTEIDCRPDNWSRIVLRLYLSESMNYHLWVRLDNGSELDTTKGVSDMGEVRSIVIKDLCRTNFLNEMELIRKWCGYGYDMHADIKHEIAKLGGYIPGAEML